MHHPMTTADLAHARRADLRRHTHAHGLRMATPRRGRAPALFSLGRYVTRLATVLAAGRGSSRPGGAQVGNGIEPACPTC